MCVYIVCCAPTLFLYCAAYILFGIVNFHSISITRGFATMFTSFAVARIFPTRIGAQRRVAAAQLLCTFSLLLHSAVMRERWRMGGEGDGGNIHRKRAAIKIHVPNMLSPAQQIAIWRNWTKFIKRNYGYFGRNGQYSWNISEWKALHETTNNEEIRPLWIVANSFFWS